MRIASLLFFTFSLYAQHVVILVPGTWACNETWHTSQGNFFKELQQAAQDLNMQVTTYNWSGKLSYDARIQAAHGLVMFMHSYPENTQFTVIAHSHGGNVVYEASQQLYTQGYCNYIRALYTLATPCSELEVLPNMAVIEYVYHFFSYADLVQTVHGMYDRTLPSHPRCTNLRISINNREPDHADMHHTMIGTWLLYLHEYYIKNKIGSFAQFEYQNPGIILLFPFLEPRYQLDEDREQDLYLDRKFMYQFMYQLSNASFDRTYSIRRCSSGAMALFGGPDV